MFQTQVKWFGEGQEGTIDLILDDVVKVRSRFYRFFKMKHRIFYSKIK